MKLSFKKKEQPLTAQQESLAQKIALSITTKQRKWADWLQQKSERIPSRAKWSLFIAFCIITLAGSNYLIVSSLAKKVPSKISVTRIKNPVQLEAATPQIEILGKAEYERLHSFRMFMDSLARSPTPQYRQFQKEHPWLLDSIKKLEEIYQSQLKQ